MNGLLLDTSAVIGLLERHTPALRRAVEAQPLPIHVSAITLGELHHGVESSSDAVTLQRRRSSLETIEKSCITVDVTTLEASVYGPLSTRLRGAGFGPRSVGAADRWISSTAITQNLTLVTQDKVLADALTILGYGEIVALYEQPS